MRLSASQIEASKQEAEHLCGDRLPARQRGFTMVELIAVTVILGILAAMAAPRFFGHNVFDSRGFYDQVISTLRYAQKAAIAQRRLVCVTFPSATRVVLRTAASFSDAACNTDLQSPSGTYPAGQTTYTIDAPSGVSLSGYGNFNFDALGRPSVAQSITVSGYTNAITVEAETGYVH